MYSLKKTIVIVVLASIIQGCASTPGIYNPGDLSDSQLALLQAPKLGYFDESFDVNIFSVTDEGGAMVIGKQGYNFNARDQWKIVKLKPAKYTLRLSCYNSLVSSLGYVSADLNAGDNLVISCERDKENRRKIDIKLVPYKEFYKGKL